jgi:hypothetical protein
MKEGNLFVNSGKYKITIKNNYLPNYKQKNSEYAQEVFAILDQHLDLHTSQGPEGKNKKPH